MEETPPAQLPDEFGEWPDDKALREIQQQIMQDRRAKLRRRRHAVKYWFGPDHKEGA